MNAKDQALMDETISKMKAEFAVALKDALLPLVLEVNALQQRSSNFAARVNADRALTRARFQALEAQVLALTPAVKVPPRARLTTAEWNEATKYLKAKYPGKTFFAPAQVHAEHALLRELAEHAKAAGELSKNLSTPDEEEVCF